MAWVDVGTDEPKWVDDNDPNYVPGGREGYVVPAGSSPSSTVAYSPAVIAQAIAQAEAAAAAGVPGAAEHVRRLKTIAAEQARARSFYNTSDAASPYPITPLIQDETGYEDLLANYYANLISPMIGRVADLPGRSGEGGTVPQALVDEYVALQQAIDVNPSRAIWDEGYRNQIRQGQIREEILNLLDPNRGYDAGGGLFGGLYEAARGLPRAAGTAARGLATNPVVMAALTAGLSVPTMVGGQALLTPMQAAAAGGALSGAASSENPLTGALRGGLTGVATAGAGQYAGGLFDNPMLAGAARGGAGALTGAVLSGSRDPYMAALQGGLFGGLSGVGKAPSLSDTEFDELMASGGTDLEGAQTPAGDPFKTGPLMVTSAGPVAFGTNPDQPGFFGAETLAAPIEGLDSPTFSLSEGLTYPTLTAPDTTEESDDAATTTEPTTAEKTATAGDYTKYAKKVYDMFKSLGFGVEVPEYQLPPQTEEMSDEEYQQALGDSLVEYLGLRPEDFEGLTPGTQEFMDYVLERADALIENIFGSDPATLLQDESVEGLQTALRDLTEDEGQELLRAMYVRGALGRTSTQTEAVDPFTGETVDIGTHAGEADRAAWQVGLARTLADIARDPQAADKLRGLLGRNVDLYGLTAAAESRNEAARRASEEEEDRLDDDEETVDEYGNPISKAERRRRRKARKA